MAIKDIIEVKIDPYQYLDKYVNCRNVDIKILGGALKINKKLDQIIISC